MAFPMKYKSQLFVALLVIRIFFPSNGYAQTKDSLSEPGDLNAQQFSQDESIPSSSDTSLTPQYPKDSLDILKWKKNREFAYMHYLDSLLKNQKNMRTDTVSVDEKSGRIKRKSEKINTPSAINNVLNSWPLKIFFWSLALLFIAFISYKVLFKNGIFKKKRKLLIQAEEDSLQDLNELSEYDFLAHEAENKNEYNLATRYLFLKTLKNLSDKGAVSFASEKTNKDYLNEMRQHKYAEEFEKLTRDYEYVWYGKFSIDKKQYQKLKEDFSFFNKKV